MDSLVEDLLFDAVVADIDRLSPDVAWIPLAKWEALTPEERRGFLPLCPNTH
ncbi:hypothetical protein [Chamaesiphon sp. OTE_75_metabat_556]|uniref:hypothetical protein n=1 Tax=Chamaesiphon sp. OTE_75_metabat_556 TaxID=2964692 RepID=UPI0037C0422D